MGRRKRLLNMPPSAVSSISVLGASSFSFAPNFGIHGSKLREWDQSSQILRETIQAWKQSRRTHVHCEEFLCRLLKEFSFRRQEHLHDYFVGSVNSFEILYKRFRDVAWNNKYTLLKNEPLVHF